MSSDNLNNTQLIGNKGEWSELYACFNILGKKGIHGGDEDRNVLEKFYPVISVLRDELTRHMKYSINKDVVIVTEDGTKIVSIPATEFLDNAQKLFNEIKIGQGRAFTIPSMDSFLSKIHCEKIKAKSEDKSDVKLVIHDYHTSSDNLFGFSIKSVAGAASTLLNASNATHFRFRIEGPVNDNLAQKINSIEGNRKMQDRVIALYDSGCKLEFDYLSQTFRNNLCMIDLKLPEMLSILLVDCYKSRNMQIIDAINRLNEKNPFELDLSEGHEIYGYKIKCLLVASALGMKPATPWTGDYEATGGYIIVKDDGDVICFHIFDRNLLEKYLFNNTKFESPDPSPHKSNYGFVYMEDGNYYFDLVLQIRFKS